MSKFFELFAKNMRSIIAFLVILGGFAYMFVFPTIEKSGIIGIMGVVLGYYFVQSKDSSDKLKADISEKNATEVTQTLKKDANEPD